MHSYNVEIVDATVDGPYERFLYRCLAPAPYRRYRSRREYLGAAIPKGFRKKALVFEGRIVGQVEYAPAEASGYPIRGIGIVVVNCIWVLRKAKGHCFGTLLLKDVMESEPSASGFATIGLEGHWSPWFVKSQLERLGFKSIDSIHVSHRTKHVGEPFTVHLMWLPRRGDAEPPRWDKKKLLEGVCFCMGHPLYHPQTYEPTEILKES